MVDERTEVIVLQYKTDQASIAKSQAALKQVAQGFDSAEAKAKALTLQASKIAIELADVKANMSKLRGDELASASKSADRLQGELDRVNAELKELHANQRTAADNFDEISRKVSLAGDVQSNLGSLAGLASTAGLGGVGQGIGSAGEIVALAEELPRLKAAVAGLPDVAKSAAAALGPAGLGVAAVLVAVAASAALFEQSLSGIKEEIEAATAANQTYFQEGRRLRTDEARQRLTELQEQLQAQRDELASIEGAFAQATANPTSGLEQLIVSLSSLSTADDALTARADELRTSITDLEGQMQGLNRAIDDGSTATNDNKQAQLDSINAVRDALAGGAGGLINTVRNTVVGIGEELTEFAEQQARQRKEIADAVAGYNTDVLALETRTAEQRAAIAERLNNALVAAAENAAKAAEDALERAQQVRDKLAADYARNEADELRKVQLERADIVLNASREEAKAARDHARNLARIRADAQEREFELALNRDFAGLFFSRRQTTKALNDATESYNAEQAERRAALNERLDDLARSYIEERNQRAAKYQQDVLDAQAQYEREKAQIEVNRRDAEAKAKQAAQREQAALAQKYTTQLALLRNGLQSELNLMSMGAQQRVELERQTQEALLAQARAFMQARIGASYAPGAGSSSVTNANTLNNSSTYNISSGNSPAQNQALVGMIEQMTLRVVKQLMAT